MLAFVDLPKAIRIVRVDTSGGGVVRTPLGRVSKATLAIEPPLTDELNAEETVELQTIIDGYVEADLVRRRNSVLSLPSILREIAEYCEGEATEVEKLFVVNAMTEATRRLRKSDLAVPKK